MNENDTAQAHLTEALRAASAAAEEFAAFPDEGTCNLDSAVFWPERSLRTATIQAAAEAAGVRISVSEWLGRCVFVQVGRGQAARNTAMAEAAAKALRRAGLNAGMYYRVD